MKIVKPQNIYSKELKNNTLVNIDENEKINYSNFANEECNNINLYEVEFEHCKFNNICMQKGKLEKITFRDVLFEKCNFSNTEFSETAFIRCEFNNCKLSGCKFSGNKSKEYLF